MAELKGQIAQMIADQEELVEKAAQSDQLRDWLEQVIMPIDLVCSSMMYVCRYH